MQDMAAGPAVCADVQQSVSHPVVVRVEAEVGERRLVGRGVREAVDGGHQIDDGLGRQSRHRG
ncbi:hypothetical protein GCM10018793_45390 [Streptomyces sulfonofaciens]|uniref:Uncharacterized protein n=1 Tax=Streptomyces sulfonofaciens TaxID=68272 RepID=A0A919GG18_9ACTN|nr:hypothetical protein GCM10018793_45390 [Streptomyces sulfonofaciens]